MKSPAISSGGSWEKSPKSRIDVKAAAIVPMARSRLFSREAPTVGCDNINTVIRIQVE